MCVCLSVCRYLAPLYAKELSLPLSHQLVIDPSSAAVVAAALALFPGQFNHIGAIFIFGSSDGLLLLLR